MGTLILLLTMAGFLAIVVVGGLWLDAIARSDADMAEAEANIAAWRAAA